MQRWKIYIQEHREIITIFHKSGNIHKKADVICKWALENTPESPAWLPQEENHIEGICVTEIGTELLSQAKESYKLDNIFHISFQILMKYLKHPLSSSKLDELW
ncbi:hypothetical protein O181_030642 [Austropuccinia psidii MF-1]|uniref:Uncharacterized protein n=1 Tax=Austropuccinia psidii MF-1 TaxID=1389203 RepID=A0A9Q3CW49_9BASI|nr:hypothetical protein [Austropuccinia psidii MF-1]